MKALVEQEVKNGIPSNRIIVGGFSQVKWITCFLSSTNSVIVEGDLYTLKSLVLVTWITIFIIMVFYTPSQYFP